MSGGTGRVGLTVVGQVVGAYLTGGSPIGAAIGGAIGSAVGGAIWPEQIDGPKLEGMQVTSSAYGGPIPSVYGTVRIGGNIIWASEIRESATSEQQGKGGGAEVTRYTYSVDLDVALCAGPVVGLRRLWFDQKLVYDVSDDAALGTIYSSFARGGLGLAFYPGTEDQLPNPVIEAALGVGMTPALRGVAHIVIANLELGEYGNRVPNITAEIVGGGTEGGPREIFALDPWALEGGTSASHVRLLSVGGELVARREDNFGASEIGFVSELDGDNVIATSPAIITPSPGNAALDYPYDFGSLLLSTNGEIGIYAASLAFTNTSGPSGLDAQVLGTGNDDGGIEADYTSALTDGGNYIAGIIGCADGQHILGLYAEALIDPAGIPTYWVLWNFNDFAISEVRRGTCDPSLVYKRAGGAMSGKVSGSVGGVQKYYAGMLESDLVNSWWTDSGASEVVLNTIGDDDVLRTTLTIDFSTPAPSFSPCSIFADNACAWVYMGGNLYGFTRGPTYIIEETLDDVVSKICIDADLTAGDINVTDLADVAVRGYLRTPRMSARAAIEPLMTAYGFDAVESDLKIKFVKRNADAAVEIPADDLGADEGEIGSDVLVDSERAQESELPVAIDVSYMAVQTDYQIGTQTVRRQVTESIDQQSIRLALALEDQEAAEICARMIYELWLARNTRKWSTTIKYTEYEPTDVVDVVSDAATYRVRIIDKQERGNLIAWTGVDVDAAAFNPTVTAQAVPPGGQTVTLPGLTHAVVADLPPLLETHFGRTGYYAGAAGFSAGWPGCNIYRKGESSGDYVSELGFGGPSTIGATLDALGAHGTDVGGYRIYRGWYPDHVNSVTVSLTAGSLSSCTDAEFLEGQNVALVGDEIIFFRDVEQTGSTGANIYVLSCLMRGALGTEWFAKLEPATYDAVIEIVNGEPVSHSVELVQGHRVGNAFMLLDLDFVQHYDSNSGTARLQGKIKPVTKGATLGGTGTQDLITTYASIVQPHPVHLSGYLSGTNLILDFHPRTFIGGAWQDGTDAWIDPLWHRYIADIEGFDGFGSVGGALLTLDGTPPFTIYNTSLPYGANRYAVRVAAIPQQKGTAAFGETPEHANRHWSQQITVS